MNAQGVRSAIQHLTVPAMVILQVLSVQAVEVYTFESLAVNNFIDGQDLWKDQPGQGDAVISLDDTGNGTKVVRHLRTGVFDQVAYITRTNNSSFNFVSFTGMETNAVIQFEASGEHAAMFALGCDRNGDGLLLSADGELGPSFGVYDRNFRIQEANLGTAYDDGFNQGGGDGNSGNDWYRLQLRLDFTANDGEGIGSLYFMNLTVQWRGGTGPYQLEQCEALIDGNWENEGDATTQTNATAVLAADTGFFRITQP